MHGAADMCVPLVLCKHNVPAPTDNPSLLTNIKMRINSALDLSAVDENTTL